MAELKYFTHSFHFARKIPELHSRPFVGAKPLSLSKSSRYLTQAPAKSGAWIDLLHYHTGDRFYVVRTVTP